MRLLSILALFALALDPRPAAAIRPFDGTDATVIDPGWLELELGPVGWRDAQNDRVVAPFAVLNYGLAPGWEVAAQASASWLASGREGGEPRAALENGEVVVKRMLRSGVLQQETGPSLALELAALLPTSRAGDEAGARATVVVSHALGGFIGHVSASGAFTRLHEPGWGGDLIVEGPEWRRVHPVFEVAYGRERRVGSTTSGLVGVIWAPRGDLSFDLAFRLARETGATVRETRIGVTWKIEKFAVPLP